MNKDLRYFFTEREAAEEFFGWSVEKMRQIRKSGKIKYYRFSDKTIKYSLNQLEEYRDSFLKQ